MRISCPTHPEKKSLAHAVGYGIENGNGEWGMAAGHV